MKKNVKDDFPLFEIQSNLSYLDSAATSLTPHVVIEAMSQYYREYRASVHRGMYPTAVKATEQYEAARATVAQWINAPEPETVIFTSGVTAGMNMIAWSLTDRVKKGDNIVLTRLEHHANLIPWQQLAKRTEAELRFIELTDDGRIDEPSIERVIDEKTAIVSVTMISNAIGTIVPVEIIIGAAKEVGAVTILDAAQAAGHQPIDVQMLGCDALLFSGHKCYGPTGVGVLYGTRDFLESLEPAVTGGEMVETVDYETATWAALPHKFEAGTPNVAGAIGLATATVYIDHLGFDAIQKHEAELTKYALTKLRDICPIVGPQLASQRSGIISFTVGDLHPHDIAGLLGESNICVRAGHHCAMPLMKQLGLSGTVRLSLGCYNTRDDIDRLCDGLIQIREKMA